MGVNFKFNTEGFAEGSSTATGNYSHAEGSETIASGQASHAEGAKYESNRNTESAGQASHAEGASTYAKADGSHAEGILNIAGRSFDEISTAAQELGISGTQQELAAKLLGYGAHVEGMNNEALGSCSHSEGNATKALANSTHAEGDTTIAFGEASHAEGYNTQAKGNQSHAEGSSTVAEGNSSHAEGVSTTASGSFSHAEGSHTEATGRDSHAEGAYNKAIGIASHAEGNNNIAPNEAQHVSGKFATVDESGTSIFQVGIGSDVDNRKDALRIKTDGDIIIQQDDQEIVLQDKLESLQKQIDGEISSWFFEGEPTTTNSPASDWTTDELKQRHEGDTYTNINISTNEHFNNPDIWENGSTKDTIGNTYEQDKTVTSNRLRTKELLKNNGDKITILTADWQLFIQYYNSEKKLASTAPYATSIELNKSYPYYTIVLKKSDGITSITPSMISTLSIVVEGKSDYDPTAGQSWRWCNVDDEYGDGWHWHKIADSDAVKALQEAAKAQQLANTAQSTANEVREDFDNLEIGGRNLLLNSKPYNNTNWKCHNGTISFENNVIKGQTASDWSRIYTDQFKNYTLVEGEEYTFSAMIRSNVAGKRLVFIGDFSGTINNIKFYEGEIGTEWTRVVKTAKVTNTNTSDSYFQITIPSKWSAGASTDEYIELKELKLEKGNKATDWTPSTEDVEAEINSKLSLSGGTIQGDVLPYTSAPQIGTIVATGPGEPTPTYISLGSTDNYFEGVYAREFKGLADNALKLYTYGTGIQLLRTPIAINEGNESTPVYFSNGVPVACSIQNTYVKKAGDTMTGALYALAFYETSDVRKKDVKFDLSLDKCYDLIDKCQTIIYSLKGQTQEQVGMIAQEIEEFFPEVVATDKDGFKSLAYDRLVVICFKVLKDVIKRLEKLEQ